MVKLLSRRHAYKVSVFSSFGNFWQARQGWSRRIFAIQAFLPKQKYQNATWQMLETFNDSAEMYSARRGAPCHAQNSQK